MTAFLDVASRLWRKYQPTSCALWAPPIEECYEDLSENGLESWKEKVQYLQNEIALRQHGSISISEGVIFDEIQRCIEEQKMRRWDAAYESNAASLNVVRKNHAS